MSRTTKRPRVGVALTLARRSTRRVPVGWSRGAARTIAVAGVLLAASAPQTASAHWTRVSRSPSSTVPYFVCPPKRDRPRCELIEDPTRGSHRRGPVSAGAITTGPELEVSPALSGRGHEGGYSPLDLQSAYDTPPSPAGSGQTVAVVDAFDDPKAESDLQTYRSEYKLPACTKADGCFRKVDQTGGASYPASNAEWGREISLDLDMVSAICPSCHILLVEANEASQEDLGEAENQAVTQGATEISNSFATPTGAERAYATDYDHPGIPITAAAGDEGYGVSSPASNPHVIAVGGTKLESTRSGWSEEVWYEDVGGEISGTGSGCSAEPKPAWQTDPGCEYRTDNDVAAVADLNTPVSVYDSFPTGGWRLVGGTSAAAPIVAATMALSNPYTRSFDGAEALYLAHAINNNAFRDIVSGANGPCGTYLCEAEPGYAYDGPAGLGSIHGALEVPAPKPATGSATSVKQTEATLSATVNTDGAEVPECRFEYGTTTAYGSSAPCSSSGGSGTARCLCRRRSPASPRQPGTTSESRWTTPEAPPRAATCRSRRWGGTCRRSPRRRHRRSRRPRLR